MNEADIDPAHLEDLFADDPASTDPPAPRGTAARLRAIHALVSSGDYHVPAAAIADRMIERLMTERLGRGR